MLSPFPQKNTGKRIYGENSLVLGKIYEEELRAAVSGESLTVKESGARQPYAAARQLRYSGDRSSGPIFSRH